MALPDLECTRKAGALAADRRLDQAALLTPEIAQLSARYRLRGDISQPFNRHGYYDDLRRFQIERRV